MNANINASGEAVIPGETSNTGLVAWINRDDYLSAGGSLLPYDEDICWDGAGCIVNSKGPSRQ